MVRVPTHAKSCQPDSAFLWGRYRMHGGQRHEGWLSDTDRVWTNNHIAHYTGLTKPSLVDQLPQRFSFIFLTERMGVCMLNFLQSLKTGAHPVLPSHVNVVVDTPPQRERVNRNLDVRRKNITREFQELWNTEGEVPQRLLQTKQVWESFKERNSLDFMLYDLALKQNCSARLR